MSDKYILDGKTPILEPDLIKWAKNFEASDRMVAEDRVGESRISTVFLGLDHSFNSDIPILFETMVFGGKFDMEEERYSTWDEALEGHKRMVKRVKEST